MIASWMADDLVVALDAIPAPLKTRDERGLAGNGRTTEGDSGQPTFCVEGRSCEERDQRIRYM